VSSSEPERPLRLARVAAHLERFNLQPFYHSTTANPHRRRLDGADVEKAQMRQASLAHAPPVAPSISHPTPPPLHSYSAEVLDCAAETEGKEPPRGSQTEDASRRRCVRSDITGVKKPADAARGRQAMPDLL
jgi:hypothetical protein